MMKKIIFALFVIGACIGYAEEFKGDPIEWEEPVSEPVIPIEWDVFTTAINSNGFGVEGKTISLDGDMSTTYKRKDHVVTVDKGLVTKVSGGNGAGQYNYPTNTFTSVASGYSHCVGLTADGKVICWGYSAHNQCAVPDDLGKATAVAAGHSHTLALVDGKVIGWGDNHSHQLDVIEGLPAIVEIGASGNSSIAIDKNKNVYVWGNNSQPMKYIKEDDKSK